MKAVRVRRLMLGALLAAGLCAVATSDRFVPKVAAQTFCGLRYVASGDDIPAGHDVTESERYSHHLWDDHLKKWGQWCEFNIAKNQTTSATVISGGQLAQTWNYRPDLITLTVGEQNTTIVNLITSCFDNVKDHEFSEANACAAAILGNTSLFNQLNLNLTTILQQYRLIQAGRPGLMVAVTGFPNPYPKELEATAKIAELCPLLMDTALTCTVRWAQLPPALLIIDQVFTQLNTTIANAVKPFTIGSGGRIIFVNTYDKMRDHCMKMEVEIKTTVEHPEEEGAVHEHNSLKVNFGCSDPWFVAGEDGTASPFLYLQPAAPGVLTKASQTTSGMGVYPNDSGHKCISDLIWEADTPEPGVTPLKWKLRVPEAPNSNICQGS
ncbi:MAG TPA: hypothetical protein VEL51_06910 [Vicinamibacterales bacterium]|nr:hypothetical protein [Vicinamibacterales bacterium]